MCKILEQAGNTRRLLQKYLSSRFNYTLQLIAKMHLVLFCCQSTDYLYIFRCFLK